ncbi:phosphoinositide 3-kinase regulatory subunit 5-like isoform X1 [Xiphophorus hellerii]|uniref:phosphoinositide 3-kinase regulatory subunit 5-like isoform X1 n=2 Tax=Xiphophorus hellerii TaxID=8084 RepID=UPI0013B3CF40|nr:phosphoinositide 3-kinase regulatory subunit 5-like isoform X1 [Xiphophorus hellerii]XP_032442652.1 phosphoinositide 3-kinase regulatory subunit 5-like isoform X1 [Xiphophorus hellerii]
MVLQTMEQSSCTEDRIQHSLERCLCHLGVDSPDKKLWNAGLCISRWCLEELVKRHPHNFLILLQKILQKTKEVLEECQYELVVPLTLLFSAALLKSPHLGAGCCVLQEAYLLFHQFLAWPEPCSSASRRLLVVIEQEIRAPGISFQRLVRTEQAISPDLNCSKTLVVLLVSPDADAPQEVQLTSEQLSTMHYSSRNIITTLILHSFQAAFGTKLDLRVLHAALQEKELYELEQLYETITGSMETATSGADHTAAREGLLRSLEKLRESLSVPSGCSETGSLESLTLPYPKCHTCLWDEDNFDVLKDLLLVDSDLDSPPECFPKIDEDDTFDTSIDEEDEQDSSSKRDDPFQSHRISTASSSSRDSTFSGYSLSSSWSVPSASSGVESDFSEDTAHEDTEEGQGSQLKVRKKPKKKSKSLLGLERFSLLFKTPHSPSTSRRVRSMGYNGDITKDYLMTGAQLKHSGTPMRHIRHLNVSTAPVDPSAPQRHICVRRRPILSCSEANEAEVLTVVKVVAFGGDREAGRLARAYSDLQQKERKCPQLTRTCKLQFYFVPTKRKSVSPGAGHMPAEGQESNCQEVEDSTTDIAQMLGMMDPWYERNVFSLLSLSSEVLCEGAPKEDDVSGGTGATEHRLPLLADLVLYYCRHADQPVLVQLYQAELTLEGGEKRKEVFIHSLELGHTAGARAVKAMGAVSKRLGIDEEREAVPLTLNVAYNKVAVSGRSHWMHKEAVCTSINLQKTCRESKQLDSKEGLQLTMTEVVKKQSSKSKKGYNQILLSEVKVDKMQVTAQGDGSTFAVCLDQDKKTFIQSVKRCEVSLCSKPGSSSDWRSYKTLPGQIQPLHPTFCSLLCLPVTAFSAADP